MQKDVHSECSPLPSGGLIRLQARATDLTTWLAPTWAVLCGVVASGRFSWDGQDWLRLALLILLVDGGWGTIWSALGATDWATPLQRWRQSPSDEEADNTSIAVLPYTLPDAPGGRVRRVLGRLHAWWRDEARPNCGSSLQALVIALPVTALLGALLGPQLLLLSLAALALSQLGVLWEAGRGVVPPGWDALIAVTWPWLAGHVAFGPVTLPSAGLAALFALSWGMAWRTRSNRGRAVAAGGQLLAAASLVALRRPFPAGALFLLLVPQLALLPWTRTDHPATWYVRYTRPWLMAAMAVAAFAL